MPLRTFVPEHQWPATASRRRDVAAYMMDVMLPKPTIEHVLRTFAQGIHTTVRNGILHTTDGMCIEAAIVHGDEAVDDGAVAPLRLVGLAFHCLWHTFGPGDPHIMPCLVLQVLQTMPANPFVAALYAHVWPLIGVPPAVQAGMTVGRPDLLYFVQQAYMQWIARVRRPELVDEALDLLLAHPWAFDTTWPSYVFFRTAVESAGVQCALPRGTAATDASLVSKVHSATVYINGWPALVVSRRDRVLLAFMFLWHDQSAWATKGLPTGVVPACFARLQVEQPYTFDASLPAPACMFDEVLT